MAQQNVLSRIRSFLTPGKGLSKDQVARLNRLPPDERLAQLGVVLHDICVKTAARFVEEEHRRADSPFRNLPKTDLFHELLVMNFWVFERHFRGKMQPLLDHLYHHHNASFVLGWESSREKLLDSMRVKFRTYDQAWDDYTGHQDIFGRQAIGIIFGDQNVASAPQAAFWLITYADRTMKEFTKIEASVNQIVGKEPSA